MGRKSNTEIEHLGRVIKVDKDKIVVSIVSQSACSSCHSKGSCSVGDIEEKLVDIQNTEGNNLQINDLVTVVLNGNMGAIAVLLGYFIPFLVLLFTLIFMNSLGFSEGVSGLAAIGSLAPYYFILFLTRKKHASTFNFRIK